MKKKGLALALKKRLKRGESFERLSRIYSLKKDPGRVTTASHKMFASACLPPAGKNPVGKTGEQTEEIGPVLKSPYGWHVFLPKEKRAGRQKSLSEARSLIIRRLKASSLEGQLQTWLKQELKEEKIYKDKLLLDKFRIQYKSNRI